MDLLAVKAGEPIQVGEITGYRWWRYRFPPHHAPTQLLSWVPDRRWFPNTIFEADHSPDKGEHGVHGFKTPDEMIAACINGPESLVRRAQMTGCDGIVIGAVSMWGIVWQHSHGYRAEYARPIIFFEANGNRTKEALEDLNALFSIRTSGD